MPDLEKRRYNLYLKPTSNPLIVVVIRCTQCWNRPIAYIAVGATPEYMGFKSTFFLSYEFMSDREKLRYNIRPRSQTHIKPTYPVVDKCYTHI